MLNVLTIGLAIVILVLCFAVSSFVFLRWNGVRDQLEWRSLKFGTSVLLIQSSIQLLFQVLNAAIVGPFFAVAVSMFYVSRVIDVTLGRNLLIVLLMPLAATLLCAPILLVAFSAGGN